MNFTVENTILLWGTNNALGIGNAISKNTSYLTNDIGKPVFDLKNDDGGFPHTINGDTINTSQQFFIKLGELGFF